jgi:O-antigen ligase
VRPAASAAVAALGAWAFVALARIGDLAPSAQVAVLAAGVSLVLAATVRGRPAAAIARLPEARLVGALFALGILSLPFSAWPGGSVAFLIDWAKSLLFFAVLLHVVRSMADAERLARALVAAVLVLGVLSLAMVRAERIEFQSYDPNDLAFVMVCGLPWAVMLAARGTGAWRLLAMGAAALAVTTVVLTRSRGGFLSLVVVGALLFLRLRRRSLAATAVAAGIAALVLVAASPAFWDRMGTILQSGEADPVDYDRGGLVAARLEVWRAGLSLMLARPFTGVGVGAFEVAYRHAFGVWKAGHSAYLQIGAELGVAGLALFVALLVRARAGARAAARTLREAPRSSRHLWVSEALEVSVWGYAAAAAGLSQAYSLWFYVLVGLGAVLPRLAVRHAAGPSEAPLPAVTLHPGRGDGRGWPRRANGPGPGASEPFRHRRSAPAVPAGQESR